LEKIAILKDNEIFDLQTASELNIEGDDILFDNSKESLEIIRHSTAHLMAEAIKILYPEAKFFVGPTVDEGFYYDFRVNSSISDSDLKAIEKEMKNLIKKKAEITKYYISKDEALEKFKDDDLKLEVLKKIPDEKVSIYSQGNFEDLCRGPHVPSVKMLHNFKLTRVAGAYLGGDASISIAFTSGIASLYPSIFISGLVAISISNSILPSSFSSNLAKPGSPIISFCSIFNSAIAVVKTSLTASFFASSFNF
jgi:threonyl-tRNA synthetase